MDRKIPTKSAAGLRQRWRRQHRRNGPGCLSSRSRRTGCNGLCRPISLKVLAGNSTAPAGAAVRQRAICFEVLKLDASHTFWLALCDNYNELTLSPAALTTLFVAMVALDRSLRADVIYSDCRANSPAIGWPFVCCRLRPNTHKNCLRSRVHTIDDLITDPIAPVVSVPPVVVIRLAACGADHTRALALWGHDLAAHAHTNGLKPPASQPTNLHANIRLFRFVASGL